MDRNEFDSIEDTINEVEETDLELTNLNSGISSLINNLIIDEYEAIEAYNSVIVSMQNEGCSDDVINVLNDIVSEENVHVGQLQEVLKRYSTNADKIEDGVEEAKEQLDDIEQSIVVDDYDDEIEESYGGAYDIGENEYFTRDDLLDFGYVVSDLVSNKAGTFWDIYDVDMKDNNTVYIDLYNSVADVDIFTEFKIDMRKIKVPSDLIKAYANTVAEKLYAQIED